MRPENWDVGKPVEDFLKLVVDGRGSIQPIVGGAAPGLVVLIL